MTNEKITTINITPTPEGCRQLKKLAMDSIALYEQQLKDLKALEKKCNRLKFGVRTNAVREMVEEMIGTKQAKIEESISSLTASRDELERCGY